MQRARDRNTNFIELDRSESKFCVKVDAYELFIYNSDASYFPLSERGHMANCGATSVGGYNRV